MQWFDGGVVIFLWFVGGIVVLGNFDGFYFGYQVVVVCVIVWVRVEGCFVLVVMFDLYLVCYFCFDIMLFCLIMFDQCEWLFVDVGVDVMVVFYFDGDFVVLIVEQFIVECLECNLWIVGVVMGEDFIFGYVKSGIVDMFVVSGFVYGFCVEIVGVVVLDGEMVFLICICDVFCWGDMVIVICLLMWLFVI